MFPTPTQTPNCTPKPENLTANHGKGEVRVPGQPGPAAQRCRVLRPQSRKQVPVPASYVSSHPPCTLHPTPYTPHPTPCTPHPHLTPDAQRPTRSIAHSASYTLHPPHPALRPTPDALNRAHERRPEAVGAVILRCGTKTPSRSASDTGGVVTDRRRLRAMFVEELGKFVRQIFSKVSPSVVFGSDYARERHFANLSKFPLSLSLCLFLSLSPSLSLSFFLCLFFSLPLSFARARLLVRAHTCVCRIQGGACERDGDADTQAPLRMCAHAHMCALAYVCSS